ncbi:MAG: hypothetical protein LBC18_03020, partial [Opitutaceae bacterium]|nr:hypothetical protein [Opitutaceae bacterium]
MAVTASNPLLALQQRARDILAATPALETCKIFIEDKEGLEFTLSKGLGTLEQPVILIGSADGAETAANMGALTLRETLAIALLYRPLFGADGAPLPSDLLSAIITALHQAPIDPANTGLGAPYFRVTGHAAGESGAGTVQYGITLTAPLAL